MHRRRRINEMTRSITRSIICMAGAAAVLCAQNLPMPLQDLSVVREGAYWARTTQEITLSAVQPRLQVAASGHITLRGGSGDKIVWRLKQRVSALNGRSEQTARILLGDIAATSVSFDNLIHLSVTSSPRVINELEVTVPRHMETVILLTPMGGIAAYDVDGDVRAKAGSGTIELSEIGGNVLQAQTGGGNIHLGKIGGSVQHCRTDAGAVYLDSPNRDANCVTAGGDITVQEAGGPLDLSTGGGNIRVGKAASSVRALSMAGLIDIGQAGGLVFADARGGSIRVASARGVNAASVSGMVSVRSSSGPMSVSTAMGSILAELLAGARLEDSSLVAGSGDITVLIPSNFPVSIVWPGTSQIRSEFPEIQANSTAFFRPPTVVQGTLNGGGPVLRLNAGAGMIYLRRVKQ
jgi:hypothetical protein